MNLRSGLFLAILLSTSAVSYCQVLDENFKLITRGVGYVSASASGDNVLVYSDFDHIDSQYHGRLLLLDHNGQLVDGFANVFADGIIMNATTLTNGQFLIHGLFTHINGVETNNLARLNADGTLDESFHSALDDISDYGIQSDGKVIVVKSGSLKRLNVDGSLDAFPYSGYVSDWSNILVGANDEIYHTDSWTRAVIKVLSNGTTDSNFSSKPTDTNGFVWGLALAPDGNILVHGTFTSYNNEARALAVKIDDNGNLINEFNASGLLNGVVRDAFVRPDNSIVLAGTITTSDGARSIVKLDASGNISNSYYDTSFESVYVISETTSRNFVASGPVLYSANNSVGVKLFDQGLIPTGEFSPEISRVTLYYNSASLDPCGPFYVNTGEKTAGPFSNPLPTTVQLTTQGIDEAAAELIWGVQGESFPNLYNSLPESSQVDKVLIQSNGKAVVSGYIPLREDDPRAVIRINADGSLDETFNTNAYLANVAASRVDDIAMDVYDRIYVTGYSASSYSYGVIRLNPDGTLDQTFTIGAVSYDPVGFNGLGITPNLLQILPDSTLMLAGNFAAYNGVEARSVVHIDDLGDVIPMAGVQFGRGSSITFMGYTAGSLFLRGYFINPDYTEVSAVARIYFEEAGTAPEQPVSVKVTAHGNGVKLMWDEANYQGQYYIVERSINSEENGFELLGNVQKMRELVDEDIFSLNTYRYRIKAINCFGASPWSEVVSIAVGELPTAPSDLLASYEGDDVELTWSDNSTNETYFVIEKYISGNSAVLRSDTVWANSTLFKYEDVIPGVYQFRVRSEVGFIYSDWSNTVTLDCRPAPEAPSDLIATVNRFKEFIITWNDNSSAEDYFVLELYSVTADELVTSDTLPANSTQILYTYLFPDHTYLFRIRSEHTGAFSDWSNTATVDFHAPTAPTELRAEQYPGAITLNWKDNSSNEEYFLIEWISQDGVLLKTDTVASNITELEFPNDQNDVVYLFRARAENIVGYSAWTDVIITLPPAAPAPPANFQAMPGKNKSFLLSWTDVDNASAYELERINATGSDTVRFFYPADTYEAEDSLISHSVAYTYRIRAISDTLFSAWITAPPVTWYYTLTAPDNLTALTDNRVSVLQWSHESEDELYFIVQRSSTSSVFSDIGIVTAGSTSWQDSTIIAFEEYQYRVQAVYEGGVSDWSNIASAVWEPLLTGSIDLTIEEADDRVYQLSWTSDVLFVEYFIMERSLGNDKSFEPIDTVQNDVDTYLDTLNTVQAYYYRVIAHTPAGQIVSNNVWLLVTGAEDDTTAPIVYPTIFSDVINVKTSHPAGTFILFSANGTASNVNAIKTEEGFTLKPSVVPGGFYLLQHCNATGCWTRKLIKQ
jgi:uncharacterized delta-60 repeat protein